MTKQRLLFTIGDGNDVGRDGAMSVVEFARKAEKLGYDGVTIGVGGLGSATGYDAFTFLAQVAVASEHLLLSTSIFPIPLVHPLILAQQVTTLDALSGGRVIFGVGVAGERYKQYEVMGVPLEERGARANETLEILKGLWTQPSFSYHGKIFHIDNLSLDPRPVQKPHPSIWIGGRIGGMEIGADGKPRYKSKTAALRRAARYGDGWLPNYMDADTYKESVCQIRAYAKEFGREKHTMTLSHNLFFAIRDSYSEAVKATEGAVRQGAVRGREFTMRYDILGTPEDCIQQLRRYADAGVTHFVMKPVLHSPEELSTQMEQFALEVMPYFK